MLVVTGLPSMQARAEESERLIDYGFREFENVALFKTGEHVDVAEVWLGEETVPLQAAGDLVFTLPRRKRDGLQVKVVYDGPIPAPITKGDRIATLQVTAPGMPAEEAPLVAGADVPERASSAASPRSAPGSASSSLDRPAAATVASAASLSWRSAAGSVFEGGEVSTHARLLAEALRDRRSQRWSSLREPGGAPGAEVLRRLLETPPAPGWSPLSEALLHNAARSEHSDKTIRPALQGGAWVISDRFADSTGAYQGAGLGLPGEVIEALRTLVVGESEPDLTIVLDVPVEDGLRRAAARAPAATATR